MLINFNKKQLHCEGKAEDLHFTICDLIFNHDSGIVSITDKASGTLIDRFGIADENDIVSIDLDIPNKNWIKVTNLLKL